MTEPRPEKNAGLEEVGAEVPAGPPAAANGVASESSPERVDSEHPATALAENSTDQATESADVVGTGRGRQIGAWVMLVAGILILGGTAWVGWRTYQAYSHLKNASAAVSQLQDQLEDVAAIDSAATAATVAHLQSESADAHAAVDDPVYRAATVLPWLGPNLGAIREVTLTVNGLSTDVMPSLVDLAGTLRPSELAPKNGAVDLAPIEQASAALQHADAAVTASRERIAGIDQSALVAPIGDAVDSLSAKLDAASSVTGTGARAARLLPPMLGSDSPRTYLVVFQNLAEPRATGGMFGSYALIKVDQGKVTVVDAGTPIRTLGVFNPPIAELTPDQVAMYTHRPAIYPADVNLTPDFPTAAAMIAKMYTARTGTSVGGVIAIDPVALSYLLEGTGPVDVGAGVVLTPDTVVPVLLSTAYRTFDDGTGNASRDAFLARAAGAAFGAVMSGDGDAGKIMNGLERAAGERRLLVWSTDQAEQADLAATELAGQLSTGTAAPSIGVFLNDGRADKLGYYLDNQVEVSAGNCHSDGTREIQVRVTLSNAAPPEGLPSYVTGIDSPGDPYLLQTNVSLFVPVSGSLLSVTKDGQVQGIARGQEGARVVGSVGVKLEPGQSTEMVFRLAIPESADENVDITPTLALTPGVTPWRTSIEHLERCSSESG